MKGTLNLGPSNIELNLLKLAVKLHHEGAYELRGQEPGSQQVTRDCPTNASNIFKQKSSVYPPVETPDEFPTILDISSIRLRRFFHFGLPASKLRELSCPEDSSRVKKGFEIAE